MSECDVLENNYVVANTFCFLCDNVLAACSLLFFLLLGLGDVLMLQVVFWYASLNYSFFVPCALFWILDLLNEMEKKKKILK